jgi:hypothetical protein
MPDNLPAMTPAGVLTLKSKEVDGVHVPATTVADATGSLVNPAKDESLQSVLATLRPSQLTTGQVSVGATAGGTVIVSARPGRRAVTIINESEVLVRLGPNGVAMDTGIPLPEVKYASVTIKGAAEIRGIVASGTADVSYYEVF